MERGSNPDFIVLSPEEKETAVRGLREDDRTELADALEQTLPHREIEPWIVRSLALSVEKLAQGHDTAARGFMSDSHRLLGQ